jgi:xeroderma pigmentosum group C-complementing protein
VFVFCIVWTIPEIIFSCRFVTNLDVAGLKPDTREMGIYNQDAARLCTRALPSSSPVSEHDVVSSAFLQDKTEDNVNTIEQRGNLGKSRKTSACKRNLSKSLSVMKADNGSRCASASKDNSTSSQFLPTSNNAEVPKRKGDLEFELHMEMALSATAVDTQNNSLSNHVNQSTGTLHNSTPPLKKLRKNLEASSSSSVVWSRSGAPLYWAEVFCGGQSSTGKWVHVDVVNDIIDGERNVEASSAVCKKPLRYVVAFAGNGAKDVTRRFAFLHISVFTILPLLQKHVVISRTNYTTTMKFNIVSIRIIVEMLLQLNVYYNVINPVQIK